MAVVTLWLGARLCHRRHLSLLYYSPGIGTAGLSSLCVEMEIAVQQLALPEDRALGLALHRHLNTHAVSVGMC